MKVAPKVFLPPNFLLSWLDTAQSIDEVFRFSKPFIKKQTFYIFPALCGFLGFTEINEVLTKSRRLTVSVSRGRRCIKQGQLSLPDNILLRYNSFGSPE